jgi:sugar lactone lactonase YvrE
MASGALSFIVLFLFATFVSAQNPCITTNPGTISSVIGQPDFTSTTAGTTDTSFDNPASVYIHASSQKVFVSENNNGRIQRFNSSAALLNGSAAEITAFGVAGNFTATQATIGGAKQITMFQDTLFVVDQDNCRVLRIDGATNATATVGLATNVYGQLLFNTSICNSSVGNDLNNPSGVAVSNNQTLWIADQLNFVVKRFDSVLSLGDYPAPNGFLGVNGTQGNTQNTFNGLTYLGIDRVNGHLFVSDGGRILLFLNAHTKADSSNADGLFGSTDFNSTSVTCNASSINGANGVYYDSSSNTLFVADTINYRVLVFSNATTAVTSGPDATSVFGQPDLTTCTTNVANVSTTHPTDVAFNPALPGLFLLIADGSFNRVSRSECQNVTFTSTGTPSGSPNASSVAASSSFLAASSSGVAASSSGVAASSSGVAASSSGAVVASSSGAVVASSSGAVVASSSGAVVASSSGAVVASSSGAVVASSSGAIPPSSSGVVPSLTESPSGPALSISGSSSKSQSNTPSETNPNALTPSNSPIAPPPPVQFGTSGVVLPVCGNGVLEGGEECDFGNAIPRTKCCTQFCTSLPLRAVCGKAASKCTKRPKCGRSQTSRQLVCNPGVAKPVGTRCGRGGLFSRKRCQADGTCTK